MGKLKSFFKNLYEFTSYSGIKDTDIQKNNDLNILFNQYFSGLFLIFFVHSIFNLIYLGLNIHTLFLSSISIFFLILTFYFHSLRNNKYVISTCMCFLTLVITYYSSACGVKSATFLFYFPLISAIPIFLSFTKDKAHIIFLIAFILLNIYVSAASDFNLVRENKMIKYQHTLMILNISSMLLFSGLNFFFWEEKKKEYYNTLTTNYNKRGLIQNLSNELSSLKELLSSQKQFTEETLDDLLNSLQLSDTIFLEKFDKHFPNFFQKLKEDTPSELTPSDLKFCALLKLGFSTKEISVYTDTSLKSVEGKKYRLRKKLRIPAHVNSQLWFTEV
ncbi:helix-turn-helix transcriptional regulator [Chryseobacterium sp. CT-SW4]|uniref:helix-turn-helix transcriptional regulator n=1 Tax=Chryseobacterium sp. SW-1 TaxID=3157343 RepID=UPI003B021800